MIEKWKLEVSAPLKHAWISEVVAGLNEVDEETAKRILKGCGESCVKIWVDFYNYDLASYNLDSWIAELNKADFRDVRRDDDNILYVLKLEQCACPLVSEKIVKSTPRLCSACFTNWLEYMFGTVAKRPVRAELVESLATGASKCAFRIWLQ